MNRHAVLARVQVSESRYEGDRGSPLRNMYE
jgi:hypothetical protein